MRGAAFTAGHGPRPGTGLAGCDALGMAMVDAEYALRRALGDLAPTTLAVMHGASYGGDGRTALHDLADAYEALAASAV